MSTKPLMPIAGRIKFTEGEPYEDGSLGKKVKDIDDSVANETSDRQYADAVIQNQLNEETLHLVPNYISNANTFFTAGAGKTNTSTTGLPPEVSAYEHDKWGTIFYLPENEEEHTGTQIYHCIAYNGSPNRGKIYKRLIISGVPTAWELVGAGSGGNITTIVETIDDAPANPQIGDRITVLQDGSTDSVPMSAVIGLINALNGKQNLLPSGTNNGDILMWDSSQNKYVSKPKWQMIYQPVEYIEATGTQWINTGLKGADGVDIDFEIIQNVQTDVGASVFSSREEHGSADWYGLEHFTWNGFFIARFSQGPQITSIPELYQSLSRHQLRYGTAFENKIYVDGEYYSDHSSVKQYSSPTSVMCLFKNALADIDKAKARIYSARFYIGSTLARDLIPVRNVSDGSIGMYDKTEGKFYGNNGTGTFLKGADI